MTGFEPQISGIGGNRSWPKLKPALNTIILNCTQATIRGLFLIYFDLFQHQHNF